jgi:hypothetical protein
VGPLTGQTRQQVLQLGQLYLRLGLSGFGPPGEDIQDQAAAIYDFGVDGSLEIPGLSRGQIVIEDDQVGL